MALQCAHARGGTQTKKQTNKHFFPSLEIGNGNIQDTVKLQTGVSLQGKLSIICRFIAILYLSESLQFTK